jgi:hypothetical protein
MHAEVCHACVPVSCVLTKPIAKMLPEVEACGQLPRENLVSRVLSL